MNTDNAQPQRELTGKERFDVARRKQEVLHAEYRKLEGSQPKEMKARLARLIRLLELALGVGGDKINRAITEGEARNVMLSILIHEIAYFASLPRSDRQADGFSTLVMHIFWDNKKRFKGCDVGFVRRPSR